MLFQFHFLLVGFKLEETKLPCVFWEYTNTKLLSFSPNKISLVQRLWMAWRSQCGWFSWLAAGFLWSFLSYSHWSTRSCNLILVEHILVLSCIVFKPKLHNNQMNSEDWSCSVHMFWTQQPSSALLVSLGVKTSNAILGGAWISFTTTNQKKLRRTWLWIKAAWNTGYFSIGLSHSITGYRIIHDYPIL